MESAYLQQDNGKDTGFLYVCKHIRLGGADGFAVQAASNVICEWDFEDSAEWGEIIPEDSRILDITGNANLPVEEVDGGLVKVTGSIMLDQAKMSSLVGIGKLVLVVVGKSTDYNGKVYFDNIKISKTVSAVTPTTAPVTTRRPYYPVIVPTETSRPTVSPEQTVAPVPAETGKPGTTTEVTSILLRYHKAN